jgi:hypothetical protein
MTMDSARAAKRTGFISKPLDAIVFVHRGANRYLPIALKQAAETNPGKRIILLGDQHNRISANNIEHYDSWSSDPSTEQLIETYIHSSTNPPEAELPCLERWFVLNRFCRAQNLQSVLYVDSDVMIFADMSQAHARFSDCQFTVSSGGCGHASYWNDMNTLDDFCRTILDVYLLARSKGLKPALASFGVLDDAALNREISDMTMLQLFVLLAGKSRQRTVGETTDIIDGATFDHNISFSAHGMHRFKMRGSAKAVSWHNGQPVGTLDGADGSNVRLDLLHCQGVGKMFMGNLSLKRSPVDLRGIAVETVLREFSRRLPPRVKSLFK